MTFNHDVVAKISLVEGFLHIDEARMLFELASNVSEGCIVEVGSYRGRSTVALALGSQHGSNVPVYAIEPHEVVADILGGSYGPRDRVEFFKNMLRVNCVETIRLIGVSSEVVAKGWDKPIALLWIDGDHRYEAVKRDFACWNPFLVKQGLVAFHDSLDEDIGPANVIKEALVKDQYQRIRQVGITTVFKKL